MRRSIQLALLASLAAAFLAWTTLGDDPPAPVAKKQKPQPKQAASLVPPPPVVAGEVVYEEPRPHDGKRNIFAYITAPVAAQPVVKREPAVVAPPMVSAVPEPPAPVEPVVERPRFAYRYIGRFGPDGNPVAAFAREGEVVTAKRGDRVGGFVVRDIGLESVEIAGDAGVVRVALGGG
jgi:hypothetical protein